MKHKAGERLPGATSNRLLPPCPSSARGTRKIPRPERGSERPPHVHRIWRPAETNGRRHKSLSHTHVHIRTPYTHARTHTRARTHAHFSPSSVPRGSGGGHKLVGPAFLFARVRDKHNRNGKAFYTMAASTKLGFPLNSAK